jgi:hypothetical protein
MSDRYEPLVTVSNGTLMARPRGAGSPVLAQGRSAACRVGSEGLKQRGRQPIRRGVRGGSPALQLRALLIRRSGQVVQDRPLRSVRWADIPELSARASRCLAAWQQYWQQSRRNGCDPRLPTFRPPSSSPLVLLGDAEVTAVVLAEGVLLAFAGVRVSVDVRASFTWSLDTS